jgi:hemerythrin-like domain-containing protein
MEANLNKGIREVIDEFPAVEKILDEYGIACGPCSVGTCLLKDIVGIHDLPADKEQEMMARIAKIIYPDEVIEIPQVKRKVEDQPKEIKYSPPMKKLVDEHVLIKRWVALIPEVINNLNVESEEGRQLLLDGVDFIRSYADKYHHAKEEEVLFKYFDEDLDILKVMHEDHERGRSHVRTILEALERKDKATIAEHLNAYRELLKEHIKKEDEILYPWMDRNLSDTQIGELFSEFNTTDEQIGFSPDKYEVFINHLEKKYLQKEA